MKFVCVGRAAAQKETLSEEYRNATVSGEVRLGTTHLFYRYFIRIKYLAYEEITQIYLREESGESGEFLLKEHYLMIQTKDGMLHKFRMERENNARAVLEQLGRQQKCIKIGYNRPSQSMNMQP